MINLGPPSDSIKRALPIALLAAAPDTTIHGRTRFQKLVFLLQEGDLIDQPSLPDEQSYEYIAHNYGPYSTELDDWLSRLHRNNVITIITTETAAGNTRDVFTLNRTALSKTSLIKGDPTDELTNRVETTISKYNDVPVLELLDRVYTAYPPYAKHVHM